MTRINLSKILELCSRATQVVSWYPHGPYDGYHPGEASVRGPFCRWLIVKEGGGWDESKPKPVANVEDDAEFAAAAMNNIVAIIEDNRRLVRALEFYGEIQHFEWYGSAEQDEPETPSGEPENWECGDGPFNYENGGVAREALKAHKNGFVDE